MIIFFVNEYTEAEFQFSAEGLSDRYLQLQPMIGDSIRGDIYLRVGGYPMVRLSGKINLVCRGDIQVDWANSS